MRVVQRRLKHTELLVWLTIAGILIGSASVVVSDKLNNPGQIEASAAINTRSRMLLDAASMPEPPATSTTSPSSTAQLALAETTTSAVPTTVPAETTPPTTVTPIAKKLPTTAPPTQPPTTPVPVTQPPTTPVPATEVPTTPAPTTTLPPETVPRETLPPETLPPETLPPVTDPPKVDDPFSSARIESFTLINAKSDNDLFRLTDGATVSLDDVGNQLSIRANVNQTVGSVVWSINGRVSKVENDSPYALAGNKGGNYGAVKVRPGTYTFTAQMFSEPKGKGEAGHAVTMTVTFVRN